MSKIVYQIYGIYGEIVYIDTTKENVSQYIEDLVNKSSINNVETAITTILIMRGEEVIKKYEFNGLPYFINEEQYYRMATLRR